MSNQLNEALSNLKKMFIHYSSIVEENVHLALEAFMDTSQETIETVLNKDKEIDSLEIKIEEECLKIIAVHQPLAKDLRLIVAILKMNNDLERIGDLAVNIVKKVSLFSDQKSPLKSKESALFLPEMIEKSTFMLKKSLDSFIEQDLDAAMEVCKIDDEVDHLKKEMKILILRKIKEGPENIEELSSILINSSHLERIADLATNIAEDVIYLIDGEIIRHNKSLSKQKPA
jgi:phosphate transport system protein